MHIILSPMRSDDRLVVERQGDRLTINGAPVDLSGLAEGASLPEGATGCAHVLGPVRRTGGRLHLTLLLPHGPDAPAETLFPAPLDPVPEGAVPLPPWAGATPCEDGGGTPPTPG